ncbi:MAG: hypothetical protein ABI612_24485, partial [Betaproteobacteria bacterium]
QQLAVLCRGWEDHLTLTVGSNRGLYTTTAAAFSARARPGLGVSMPLTWDDLPKLKSEAQWTIANAREHHSFQTSDPWADYWKTKQTLKGAMDKLGFRAGRTGR